MSEKHLYMNKLYIIGTILNLPFVVRMNNTRVHFVYVYSIFRIGIRLFDFEETRSVLGENKWHLHVNMQSMGALWNMIEYYRYLQVSWKSSIFMIVAVIWTATCIIIGTTGSIETNLYSINQVILIIIAMALLMNFKVMQFTSMNYLIK